MFFSIKLMHLHVIIKLVFFINYPDSCELYLAEFERQLCSKFGKFCDGPLIIIFTCSYFYPKKYKVKLCDTIS